MHGPTLWPTASSVSRTLYTTVNGETIEEIQGELPVVTTEEIHASDLQVGIDTEIHDEIPGSMHTDLSTDVQEVVANSIQLHDGVPAALQIPEEVAGSIQGALEFCLIWSPRGYYCLTLILICLSSLTVCSSQPGFVAMKPDPDADDQV